MAGSGQGRGWLLLVMLVVALLLDARVMRMGGYARSLSGPGGGPTAPQGMPGGVVGRWGADVVEATAAARAKAHRLRLALAQAATTRRPRLFLQAWAEHRIARDLAARRTLDAGPHRWATSALAAVAVLAGAWIINTVVPPVVTELNQRLSGLPTFWFAGILDTLAAVWESMSPTEKAALVLIGLAAVLLSGGTLGMAVNVGLGIATALDAARPAAQFVRDPWGATGHYLDTHNDLEVAADAGLAAMAIIPGGKALRGAGYAAKTARTLTREEAAAAKLANWDDPRRVQKWFDDLPTRTHPPTTPAYQYQHRVLGTNVERQLTTDGGKTIWADSVTTDGNGITMAWDAKHTKGGPNALYEGNRPEFLINDFEREIMRYRDVINSPGNPVSSLNIVTNTPESASFLGRRAREILGPNITLTVHVIP